MQFVRETSTVTLLLLMGMMAPAYAQRGQRNEEQGRAEKRQDVQRKGAPPAAQRQRSQGQPQQPQARSQQQQQGQRSQQARQQRQPQRTQQQAVAWQRQRGWLQQGGGWQGQSTWQQGRARRWESEHRTWLQRGGYGGYYIPQASFGLHFGSQHWFRMGNRPTIYMGYPRFSYGGFSFLLVDPWPEYWAEDWYGTDDVYIDYDDGYYLHNRRHPGVRLAISVAL
jgi:hypothetical protein